MPYLYKGLLIGLAIAAPVGPIGVLCMRRTLADGRLIGFLSGLGAATADMFYGAIAAFGLTAIQSALSGAQFWLRLLGGLWLVYLGLRTFTSRPASGSDAPNSVSGAASAYLSTLGLTLTNPATILSFTGAFVIFRLGTTAGNYVAAGSLTLGVLLGSALWWLGLSLGIGAFRARFTPDWMIWVNRVSGTLIAVLGLFAVASDWLLP
jgi:threonine/homoserine/homoserine lactone efflux protein